MERTTKCTGRRIKGTWITGLAALTKPLCQLHTQYNRDIPWDETDMDFMNLNQTAHGGREFGFIGSRLRMDRKVIVGHWQDETVHHRLDVWMRAATATADAASLIIARFGDNMREVVVTEGDKVEAQRVFGYAVNGYGLGDLSEYVDGAGRPGGTSLMEDYTYHFDPRRPLVLSAHMLEICPSIAAGGSAKTPGGPRIVGRETRPRDRRYGVDFRGRYPPHRLQPITREHIVDFASMAGVELLCIGDGTTVESIRNEIRWNEVYYHIARNRL